MVERPHECGQRDFTDNQATDADEERGRRERMAAQREEVAVGPQGADAHHVFPGVRVSFRSKSIAAGSTGCIIRLARPEVGRATLSECEQDREWHLRADPSPHDSTIGRSGWSTTLSKNA